MTDAVRQSYSGKGKPSKEAAKCISLTVTGRVTQDSGGTGYEEGTLQVVINDAAVLDKIRQQ